MAKGLYFFHPRFCEVIHSREVFIKRRNNCIKQEEFKGVTDLTVDVNACSGRSGVIQDVFPKRLDIFSLP